MSLRILMVNFTDYNAWANEMMVNFLALMPAQSWYTEVPSSFNTIAKTINHILAIQEYWYSVITESAYTSDRRTIGDPDAIEVFDSLVSHSVLLKEAIQKFSDEDFLKKIRVDSPRFPANLPRYEYIMQLLNHSTYHRGQVVTIGRSLGFTDAPNTDYHFYNLLKN